MTDPRHHRGTAVWQVSVRRGGGAPAVAPIERRAWPESFWRAFGGMSEGFARPPQVPEKRPGLLR
jgi:hypothetical protein